MAKIKSSKSDQGFGEGFTVASFLALLICVAVAIFAYESGKTAARRADAIINCYATNTVPMEAADGRIECLPKNFDVTYMYTPDMGSGVIVK